MKKPAAAGFCIIAPSGVYCVFSEQLLGYHAGLDFRLFPVSAIG